MSISVKSEPNTKKLIKLIRDFQKCKDSQSLHKIELEIVLNAVTLDDMITVLTLCPTGSVPFQSTKNSLLDGMSERSLVALVYIYENVHPALAQLKRLSMDIILRKADSNEDLLAVMDAITQPCHELSNEIYEKMMSRPQEKLTIFKLHRLTQSGSKEQEVLEKSLILPYLNEMAEKNLIDITMESDPKSNLMKEVRKMLDRIMI